MSPYTTGKLSVIERAGLDDYGTRKKESRSIKFLHLPIGTEFYVMPFERFGAGVDEHKCVKTSENQYRILGAKPGTRLRTVSIVDMDASLWPCGYLRTAMEIPSFVCYRSLSLGGEQLLFKFKNAPDVGASVYRNPDIGRFPDKYGKERSEDYRKGRWELEPVAWYEGAYEGLFNRGVDFIKFETPSRGYQEGVRQMQFVFDVEDLAENLDAVENFMMSDEVQLNYVDDTLSYLINSVKNSPPKRLRMTPFCR